MADPIASVPPVSPPLPSAQQGPSPNTPAQSGAAPNAGATQTTNPTTTPSAAGASAGASTESPAAIVTLGKEAAALAMTEASVDVPVVSSGATVSSTASRPAALPMPAGAMSSGSSLSASPAAQIAVSDAIAELIKGQIVTTTVIGTDARGTVALRANDGTFFAVTQPNLPVGATVTLMAEGGDPARAFMTSVNNQVMNPPVAVNLRATPAASQLLTLAAQAEANSGPALQVGQPVAARLIAVAPNSASTTATENGMARASAALGLSAADAALAPDGPLDLKLVPRAVMQPGQAIVPPGAGEIQARVIGRGLGGETIFKTDAGILALPLRNPPPNGSLVNFAVEMPTALAKPLAAPALAGDTLQRFMEDWPALRESIDVLRAVDPRAAQHLMARLPQPDARLVSTSLMFFAAVQSGAAEKWIGEGTLDSLRAGGRADLARQLVHDFTELSQLAQPRSGAEWQSMVMPFFTGAEIRQIQVYLRKRRKRPGDRRPATRFVIDLQLEKTGPMQFDGLTEDDRLDITLRSGNSLPGQWENDIRRIYGDCIGATGMRGSISFQAGLGHFVRPAEDMQRPGRSGVLA